MDSDFISDFEVKGVEIDTSKHTSRGTDSSTHQNDVISIGDYKMKKSITGETHDMEVKTRKGHDSLKCQFDQIFRSLCLWIFRKFM